ncbi:hypothetical protein IC614_03520 [Allosphingosinicella flava]|uniref:Tetratricopeptide repeat protein n=2 Tax=Allosphingosinicella flava TaxID=2771430 RepID=A0A7T2GKR9_9SPHN|nr:hypothetical protein IC614_03520 [Sphingosinicella flava]
MTFFLVGVSPAAMAAVQQQQAPAPAREYKLSKEERNGLAPLQAAVNAKDTAAATAALPAAQAAAKGADAQYVLGQLMLKLGIDSNNEAIQRQAIDRLLATASTPQKDLSTLYLNQAALADRAGDRKTAENALTKAAQISPNDPDVLLSLAELKVDGKKGAEAVDLISRAIDMRKAAGQPVPDTWYKRALSLAFQNKMAPQSVALGKALVAAYPTPTNWRDALLIYRDSSTLDAQAQLDLFRLMRAAKGLTGERDYFRFADQLKSGGFPGESKAVLDEGVAARHVDAAKSPFKELIAANTVQMKGDRESLGGLETKALASGTGQMALSTADAYYGYGDYAKAAALYRAALQKGGVDANLVNTRLGAALAQSGQKVEAEAALKAVQGPRADIAAFWMAWLNQRG